MQVKVLDQELSPPKVVRYTAEMKEADAVIAQALSANATVSIDLGGDESIKSVKTRLRHALNRHNEEVGENFDLEAWDNGAKTVLFNIVEGKAKANEA